MKNPHKMLACVNLFLQQVVAAAVARGRQSQISRSGREILIRPFSAASSSSFFSDIFLYFNLMDERKKGQASFPEAALLTLIVIAVY